MNRIKFTFSSSNMEIQKGFFLFFIKTGWVILSILRQILKHFTVSSLEKKMQKSPYVLFLRFMIHESRDSYYGHKLHMNGDRLFILRNKNG